MIDPHMVVATPSPPEPLAPVGGYVIFIVGV
jgi:hypothetical protein